MSLTAETSLRKCKGKARYEIEALYDFINQEIKRIHTINNPVFKVPIKYLCTAPWAMGLATHMQNY